MTDDRESDDAADWLSAQFGGLDDEHDEHDERDGAEASKTGDANPSASSRDDAAQDGTGQDGTGQDAVPPDRVTPAGDAGPVFDIEEGQGNKTAPIWPLSTSASPAVPATPGAPAGPAAPTAPASGGFSWGLTPSNATQAPEQVAPAPTKPEPAAPPTVPEPTAPPTLEPTVPEPTTTFPAVPAFTPPPLVTPPVPVLPTVPAMPPAVPPVVPASSPPDLFVPPLPPMPTTPLAGMPPVPAHTESPFAPRLQPPWRADDSGAGAASEVQPRSPELPPVSETPVAPMPSAAPGEPFPLVPPVVPEPLAAHPEPEPFDSSLAGAPSAEAEPRTMALPWESAGTELFTPAAAGSSPAEPATELLSGFETTPADAAAGSSIDSLFGATQFRDYEAEPAASQNPFARSAEPAGAAADAGTEPQRAKRQPLPHSQKVLLWIAGSLVALLILVVLFFLGTKIPHSAAAPATAPTATKTPTPSATPAVAAVGPLAPGTYKWDRLLGGECLAPFTSPWVEKFTVVDCATPHPAQMVARGTFIEPAAAATDANAPSTPAVGQQTSGASTSAYPGLAALQAQVNLLCSAPTAINFAAAGAYSDIQFTASYPATDKQWTDGDHSYYCFVTRSSGAPLTASVAVAPAP